MERVFEIRTEPHTARIGGAALLFQPEVIGSEFMTAYAKLREAQRKVTGSKGNSSKPARAEDTSPETLAEVTAAMHSFIRGLLLPESVPAYDALRLPDRVLIELIEWTAELYGGGTGKSPAAGGTSTG